MISCEDAVKQLWEYLDGEVELHRRGEIEEHLAFCRRCCGELEFAQELRRFLALSAHEEVPEDVLARLSAKLDELDPA